MKFSVGCALRYRVAVPSTLILNIEVARTAGQLVVGEQLQIEPGAGARSATLERYLMPESDNRYVRLAAAPGPLTVRYDAEVELTRHRAEPAAVRETAPADLPFPTLPHLYPSRYCPSDKLHVWASREFGDLEPGHGRVTAICNWIYEHVDYLRGSSDTTTSAYDTLVARSGVCRDFAHLGVAFCRALDIPARFVSAYAWGLQPPDFHAVFEAYLGDRWYLFDPTRQANLDGIVRIGVGRDAAEVSFATIFGDMTLEDMRVSVAPSPGTVMVDERTTAAVGAVGAEP